MSMAQLEEVKDRERMAHAQMLRRQSALEAAAAGGELKALPAAMAELQAKVTALRGVSSHSKRNVARRTQRASAPAWRATGLMSLSCSS